MQRNVFRHTHRVAYADCTVGDHIYYARYLDLLEIARNEFFRSLGQTFLELQHQDTIFPVLECRLRYKSPAHYDDVLSIEIWPTLAERVRLNLAYRILNQAGTVVLEGETFHACANVRNKPKRLPEMLRERLLPCLRPPEGDQ
jgi:acyl-CoA thioester hydrolase